MGGQIKVGKGGGQKGGGHLSLSLLIRNGFLKDIEKVLYCTYMTCTVCMKSKIMKL